MRSVDLLACFQSIKTTSLVKRGLELCILELIRPEDFRPSAKRNSFVQYHNVHYSSRAQRGHCGGWFEQC